jgi:hypothetical protein
MTDEAPINGVADLRDQLAVLLRRYVAHLDHDAPSEVQTVRVEASGPGLHVAYAESEHAPPMLTVTINQPNAKPNTPEEIQSKGWLNR